MRIFQSRWFQRFARKEGIADTALREAVIRADKGHIDADLGGEKAFFVYGFSESQRANIDDDEEQQFKEAAKHVLALTEKQLAELVKRGDFTEVKANEQKVSK